MMVRLIEAFRALRTLFDEIRKTSGWTQRPRMMEKANKALVEFGSPYLLTSNNSKEILQIDIEPDRIDI
jgi:hypothetical protein